MYITVINFAKDRTFLALVELWIFDRMTRRKPQVVSTSVLHKLWVFRTLGYSVS
jgi:hypothetical protein